MNFDGSFHNYLDDYLGEHFDDFFKDVSDKKVLRVSQGQWNNITLRQNVDFDRFIVVVDDQDAILHISNG